MIIPYTQRAISPSQKIVCFEERAFRGVPVVDCWLWGWTCYSIPPRPSSLTPCIRWHAWHYGDMGRVPSYWDSPGKSAGMGCHVLLQGTFWAQGSNPSLLNCEQIRHHLSHQGSPRILEWVACPFSRRSSQPRNRTVVSCIAGRFFTSWTTWEAQIWHHSMSVGFQLQCGFSY